MNEKQALRNALASTIGALKVVSLCDCPGLRMQGIMETIWDAEKILSPTQPQWSPYEKPHEDLLDSDLPDRPLELR